VALTQARAFGAHSGRRYGSFSGKGSSHPVGRLTQARAFGAHTGMLYGSFAGRSPVVPPPAPARRGGPPGDRGAMLDDYEMLELAVALIASGALTCH
jgi:hypothetical protein